MPRPSPIPAPRCRPPAAAALAVVLATAAILAAPASAQPADPLCDTDPTLLCLLGDRFEIRVDWRDQRSGREGAGQKVELTDRSGTFWFFHPDNVELIVKMLDGRPVNGEFWVFVGAMTDVEFFLTVRDRETSHQRTYRNPPGNLYGIADTDFSAGSDGALCGTILGLGCDQGFFCDLEPGSCGGADLAGTCTAVAAACPEVFDPVCGCDGVTYGNDCERIVAQVQKDHDGECGSGPTSLRLAVGESGQAAGLTITLLEVGDDSRCPVDVECVWEGDARATLRAQADGLDQTFDLHLHVAPKSRSLGGARVTFLGLEPPRVSGETIPLSAYRATLLVEPD